MSRPEWRVEDLQAWLAQPALRKELAAAEQAEAIPDDVYRECGRHGLFALSVPQAHGGLGLALPIRARLHGEVARISASLQSILIVHEMAAYAITHFGRPETRRTWLPAMAVGDCLGAFALTEPGGGSSFEQIRTTATGCDEGILLNGTKSWTSSGLRAGVIVVFAVSGAGHSAVLVPRDTPGLTLRPAPRMSAFRATDMSEVHLQDCVVDPLCRLGPDGFGLLRVATACLSVGRVLVAAGAVAIAAAALDTLIAHANRRVVGREPLSASQLVRKSVADAHIRVQGGRLLTQEAAVAVDSGAAEAIQQAIIAKLAATEAASLTTQDVLRLHGAAGLTADSPVLRHAAEASVYSSIEGSTEALASALGGNLLRTGRAPERTSRG